MHRKRHVAGYSNPCRGDRAVSVDRFGLVVIIAGDTAFDNLGDAFACSVERDLPRLFVFSDLQISEDLPTCRKGSTPLNASSVFKNVAPMATGVSLDVSAHLA